MKKKYFARYKKPLASMPDLVEVQKKSFDWLVKHGLKELFQEYSPIRDYSEKKFSLEFVGFQLDEPKYDEYYARDNNLSMMRPCVSAWSWLTKLSIKIKSKKFS